MTTLEERLPVEPRIFLGLVIHNHQPIGNFPWVFARAYDQAYLPMVEALEKHPSIRLSMHYSGPLLDWIETNRPELLDRLNVLVKRGQIEIVGGAYYEPVLPAIPDTDKLGQIRKMTDYCQRRFGMKPSGLWLAERVWEPSLPLHLSRAGVDWTVVDDTHFKTVGMEDADLFGYYITEDQGCAAKVFATSKFLRYSIPFKPVEEVMSYLRQNASTASSRIAVMGDDGEKFGIWPQTYEHSWGKDRWVEEFFNAIERNSSWLTMMPPGEFAHKFPPLGRAYLPCSSYDEMAEWAFPAATSRAFTELKHRMESEGCSGISRFLRGGYWRHFGVKYPEVNWMQKKMLRVHRKVYKASDSKGNPAGQDELWQGQCNCPYWHGVFGGLYLADIRAATYQHLVEAEKQADAAVHPSGPWLTTEVTDMDNDGYEEIVVDSDSFAMVFSPRQGGSIVEWDFHQPSFNILSTLARRPEAYHKDLAATVSGRNADGTETIHAGIRMKDPMATSRLAFDRTPRFSMLDHFIGPEINLQRFSDVDFAEMGDFAGLPFESSIVSERGKTLLRFVRNGHVVDNGNNVPVSLRKTIALEEGRNAIGVTYEIRNEDDRPVSGILAVEWNINLLGGGHNDAAYYEVPGAALRDSHLDSSGELPSLSRIILGNRYLGIRLELALPTACDVWRFPVETVSNSEGGVESLYQASCLVVRKPFSLGQGCHETLRMNWLQVI